MKSYPLASAVLTMVLFAVMAKIAVVVTKRLLAKIAFQDDPKIQKQLFGIIHI